MNKYAKKILISLSYVSLLTIITTNIFAMPQPRYLSVWRFDRCMETRQLASERVWCMPSIRPGFCPINSWVRLEHIAFEDGIPSCRRIELRRWHHGNYRWHHDRYVPMPPPRPRPIIGPVFDIHIGHDHHHIDHHHHG